MYVTLIAGGSLIIVGSGFAEKAGFGTALQSAGFWMAIIGATLIAVGAIGTDAKPGK